MKLNWRWFVGGRDMFWVSIFLMLVLVSGFVLTYIINPTEKSIMVPLKIDSRAIQDASEQYVRCLGIKIDKPIEYRFVKYKSQNEEDGVLLGTFHEWNGVYYIDISVDLYKTSRLNEIVIHETRHMLVEYMRDKKIIDLGKYTEEIAQEKNKYYNDLFDSGIYLLKEKENKDG